MAEKFLKRYYLLFFSTILGPLTTNSLIPIFEDLRINFGLSTISAVSLSIAFYVFPFAILQLFGGTFSDVMDKKKVVTLGFIIFILGVLLATISVIIKNFITFLIGFAIQGLGFSFINPTILAILSIITPEKKEGPIMGLYNSSAGLGISVGSVLTNFFANVIGYWQLLFVFNLIISIISLFLFLISIRNCEQLVCRSFENNFSMDEAKKQRSLIVDTFIQFRKNIKLNIVLLGIVGFSCFFGVITLTNTLNEQIRISMTNLSNQEVITMVSLILTVNGLVSICLSPVSGFLLNKINPLYMMLMGFGLLFFTIFLPFGNTFYYYMIISLIIYLGSVLIWPALFKSAMDLNPEAKGTNSAIINSLRFIGYALVGPLYLIYGIPIIYYLAMTLIIITIGTIILLKKKISKIEEIK